MKLSSFVIGWACVCWFWAMPVVAEQAKPNVILFLSDDHTYFDIGCYGSPDAVTPNIDRLAEEGMRFTRCFTSTSMCAPTRQQLYTGVWPVRSGAYPNHSRVYDGARSLGHHFGDLGYRVALAGKKHYKPAESYPIEELPAPTIEPGSGDRKPQDFDMARVAEFIERDPEQPFFLICASNQPHTPWTKGDASRYDPASLTLPPFLADTPETRRAMTEYLAEVEYMDGLLGRVLELVDRAGEIQDTIVIFTSEQGSTFPFAKWTCYDAGLRTAMVVRWPGRVQPGSVTDAMVQYIDIVPTLLDAAGSDPTAIDTGLPGAADGERGFDGLSFLPVLRGESDTLRDYTFGVHTTRGIINGSESYPIRSVRDDRYKLILNLSHEATFTNAAVLRNKVWDSWLREGEAGDEHAAAATRRYQHRPAVELYDLLLDPHEMENRADDPTLQAVRERLAEELAEWMRQQGDEGLPTEMRAKERQGRG